MLGRFLFLLAHFERGLLVLRGRAHEQQPQQIGSEPRRESFGRKDLAGASLHCPAHVAIEQLFQQSAFFCEHERLAEAFDSGAVLRGVLREGRNDFSDDAVHDLRLRCMRSAERSHEIDQS